jgi:hypothetical protein
MMRTGTRMQTPISGVIGFAVGVGLVAAVIGGTIARRTRHLGRLLGEAPWIAYTAEHLGLIVHRASPGAVLRPFDAPSEQALVLKIDEVAWRAQGLDGQPVVWMCGAPGSAVALTSPPVRQLFAASPPHGYIGRRFLRGHRTELEQLGLPATAR